MLPREHRLTDASGFTAATRGGRAGARGLVVHRAREVGSGPARVGFVVSRAVGGSVERNRVKRRLRHLVADRLDALPVGTTTAVRALPAAAGMSSAQLGRELDRALVRGSGRTAGPA